MSVLSTQDLSNIYNKTLATSRVIYNLIIDSIGFIECGELLNLPNLKQVTLNDLIQISVGCNKQRFTIKN